jgi:apolipoprotein N-acyltransferase
MKNKENDVFIKIIFFFLSYVIVAFSQPAWISCLGFLTAFLGYLLFWFSIYDLSNRKKIAFSFIWFFFVQSIQLSWLTSTKYQGELIYVVYVFLMIWFAIEFALISYIALKDQKITYLKIFFIASLWCIFEWSKLFVMCGFSFNQVGLAYANNHYSLQMAAIFGVYGLSFYVIFVNLIGLKAIKQKCIDAYILWIILALFPYFYGYFHEKIYENKFLSSSKLNVCLVQTSLLPEQKNLTKNSFDHFVSPILQWEKVINLINQTNINKFELIVFPEAAFPYGANDHFYPFENVKELFIKKFGEQILYKLPSLKEPYAINYDGIWYVSNSYFAKALSKIFDSEIAIGFDDYEPESNKYYNAAFYFHPNLELFKRYEKQILVPIGEYIPFSFLADMALKKYGIGASFSKGKENKIFSEKNAYSFSICYEETYPYLMRKARLKGANNFINLTNDAYFYKSKLFRQHFEHAKIRSVENGVPLIRACNTGVTAGVDSFGRVIDAIYSEDEAKALYIKVPQFSYKTLYLFWGDYFILGLSLISILIFYIKSRKVELNPEMEVS